MAELTTYAVDAASRRKPLGRLLLGIAACLLPLVLVYASPWRVDTALVYVGLLPAFVALPSGLRVAVGTAVATAAAMVIGLLLSASPVPAAFFLASLAIGVALSYTRGWQGPATYVATQAALAAVAAPIARAFGDGPHPRDSLANALTVGAIVLVAGLWVALVGSLLLGGLHPSARGRVWNVDLAVFAGVLAALLGVSTLVLMRHTSGGQAWWILLTILVSVAPTADDSILRALQRAGGTVLGGTIAALLILVIDDRTALASLGVLAAAASAISYVRAPYWVFSVALTVALVLLTFPTGRMLQGDLARVGYTVLAACIVIAVTVSVDAARRSIRGRMSSAAAG